MGRQSSRSSRQARRPRIGSGTSATPATKSSARSALGLRTTARSCAPRATKPNCSKRESNGSHHQVRSGQTVVAVLRTPATDDARRNEKCVPCRLQTAPSRRGGSTGIDALIQYQDVEAVVALHIFGIDFTEGLIRSTPRLLTHGANLYTRKNHLLLDICMQRGIPLIAWGDQPCHYDGSNRSQIVGSAYLYERGKTWSRKSLGQQ